MNDGTTPLPPATDAVFARLLQPVGLSDYLGHLVGGESLFIQGPSDKFDFVTDQRRIFAAIWRAHARSNIGQFMLSALEADDLSGETQVSRAISPDEIEQCLARDIPVCVNDLGAGDYRLRQLADAIGHELGLPGAVRFNCYISSGCAVTRTHIDTRATHSIQILGAKTWRYAAKPVLAWPRSTAQVDRLGNGHWMVPGVGIAPWEALGPVQQDAFKQAHLSRGDLLFVPAGTWHQVTSDGDSIALNISIKPPSYTGLISSMLQHELMADPRWRAGLPPGNCTAQADALSQILRSAITALEKYIPDEEHGQ